MKRAFLAILAVLVWLPNAKATPVTAIGAIVVGSGAAIACDHIVRSNMEASPESDEPWYRIWHHVGPEDIAGFAAGTACAIPGAAVGGAIGLGLEATLVGAYALGAGAVLAAGKGLHLGYRAVALPARRAFVQASNFHRSVRQWYGKVRLGAVAPASKLRREYMERLYTKQKGMDALCKVRLPPLYVGPIWNRRLNPDIEIDHRIPRAKGGTDHLSNLQLTHRSYNRAKSDLTGRELRRAMTRFCPVRSTS
ncbi:MAG: HNH endonuclease signature motif containing protein [Rhodospirillaceae bacterium]|nr:HNH endonuclease signature motif containing protein [Rhodospirillaceae bacterium]